MSNREPSPGRSWLSGEHGAGHQAVAASPQSGPDVGYKLFRRCPSSKKLRGLSACALRRGEGKSRARSYLNRCTRRLLGDATATLVPRGLNDTDHPNFYLVFPAFWAVLSLSSSGGIDLFTVMSAARMATRRRPHGAGSSPCRLRTKAPPPTS